MVEREQRTVDTRYGSVTVKVTRLGGKAHGRPEHEDVARIARETGTAVATIAEELAGDIAAALVGV